MISISSPTFDIQGSLVLTRTGGSRVRGGERRVSRVATLDGGAEFTDLGWSDSDRTLMLAQGRPTVVDVEKAEYLAKNYPFLIVSTEDGIFSGTAASVNVSRGDLLISFLVSDKLT